MKNPLLTNQSRQVPPIEAVLGLLIVSVFLLSCGSATYRVVTDGPSFDRLSDKRYRLVEEMYISGVSLPPGYGEEIQAYIVGPTDPTWIGPELITRDILEVGTLLTVQSITECTNCWETRMDAMVEVHSFVKAVDVPVTINIEFLVDSYVEED